MNEKKKERIICPTFLSTIHVQHDCCLATKKQALHRHGQDRNRKKRLIQLMFCWVIAQRRLKL